MNPVPVDLAEKDVDFRRRVYREVLAPALRPDEIESEELFLGYIASGDAIGIALADPPETPLSAIIGYPYRTAQVLLIGYIATRKQLRSRGMGAELLERATERWYRPTSFRMVLAEIDDPRTHPGDEATMRLRFYDKHGAKLLARPYFQPRLSASQKRVGGMLVIALWWAPEAMSDAGLAREPVVSWLHAYFEESEDGNPQDDQYARLIAAYEATPSIPLIPLNDYQKIEQILPE
jgi:GNAT superfamily N-acetyltransferase